MNYRKKGYNYNNKYIFWLKNGKTQNIIYKKPRQMPKKSAEKRTESFKPKIKK
jgi:hypothetical protein